MSRKCHCYDAAPWVKGAGGAKYKPVTAWHWDYPPELKRSLPPHLLSNFKKSVRVCSRCGLPLRCWCIPVGDGDAADTPGDQG